MTTCPMQNQLVRFLAESLSSGEVEFIEKHVETCSACRAQLQQLAENRANGHAIGARKRNAHQDDGPRDGFLKKLCLIDPFETIDAPATSASQITRSLKPTGAADGAPSGPTFPAIPDYKIERELGRGGMGVVYLAWQTALNRPVAIKMILGGKYTDSMAQARFMIEAEVIAAIQHPYVVQMFQFGRQDDQPFFVLEFVGGGSLAGKLKKTGRFTPRDAATMVAKLAEGMAAAHQKGVVHRDLKPANVLLTEAGEPKITDFGLAKTGQSDMTASGAVMGTPSYMSPEQAGARRRKSVLRPTCTPWARSCTN